MTNHALEADDFDDKGTQQFDLSFTVTRELAFAVHIQTCPYRVINAK
jgi:hypothetical protein